MTQRSHTPRPLAAFALAAGLALGTGAAAQPVLPDEAPSLSDPAVPTTPPGAPTPGELPLDRPEMELDALFAALSVAPEDGWKPIQQKIMAIWSRDDSAAMTLLLSRATKAMEAGDHEKALTFLDDVVRLDPEFAEGWNRRATVHFLREDYGRSVADIARVLALEPRHFGALSGLGIILDRLEQDEEALTVFRRALEIHPHLEGAKEAVEKLTPEVEGREL